MKFSIRLIILFIFYNSTLSSISATSTNNDIIEYPKNQNRNLYNVFNSLNENQNNQEDSFPKENQSCAEICEGFYSCDTKSKKCVHKGLFPIYPSELIQIFIIVGISMVATSVGIGGGGVYCAILLYVENFQPFEAYPISIFLIAICSFCTYINGIQDKIKFPENNFVDYDIAIVFCPTLLLGAKLGAIFNKTISNFILMLALGFFQIYIIFKSFANLIKQKEKENNSNGLNSTSPNNNYNQLRKNLMDESINSPVISDLRDEVHRECMLNASLVCEEIIKEENKPIRLDRVKYLLMFQLVSIIDQFMEGNKRVPSFLGLKQCSVGYWAVFILYIGVSIYLVDYSKKIITRNYEYKISISKELIDPKYDYLEKNWTQIVLLTTVGGVISGMLGIGGGTITTPLMLWMGLDPRSATSTSNFLIFLTTSIGTIIFILADQLKLSFCICLAIPSGIAAFWGSGLINEYINRTKKTSILITGLIFVLILSLFLLVLSTYDTIQKEGKSSVFDLFYTKPFC